MRLIAFALIVSLFTLTANAFAQESKDWRKVADAIPLGSRINVQTVDGKRVTGTLMRVDDSSVIVKRNTRMPEPAVTIALDKVSRLERDHAGGFGWAKAVGIGVGAGVGAMLTLFVIAMQID